MGYENYVMEIFDICLVLCFSSCYASSEHLTVETFICHGEGEN